MQCVQKQAYLYSSQRLIEVHLDLTYLCTCGVCMGFILKCN